eukprot:4716781-Prymnesium_polylepis.2
MFCERAGASTRSVRPKAVDGRALASLSVLALRAVGAAREKPRASDTLRGSSVAHAGCKRRSLLRAVRKRGGGLGPGAAHGAARRSDE